MPDAAPRFVWVAELPDAGGRVTLGEVESRYVARVCRARPGETISLTDGRGSLAEGRVEEIRPRVVAGVERVDRTQQARRGVLLCGAPEGQRFDWGVEKLAELGVAAVRPVDCQRARWEPSAVRHERWVRLARQALQQSLGRFAMTIEPPAPLEEAVEGVPQAAMRVLADVGGTPATRLSVPAGGDVVCVVGPSGGLAKQETDFLQGRGFGVISLSGNRLRTETAAIAWGAWWALSRISQD